jgi:hypothetical protein
MCKWCQCTQKLYIDVLGTFIQFVSASAFSTHAFNTIISLGNGKTPVIKQIKFIDFCQAAVVVVIIWYLVVGFTTTYAISAYIAITTKIVSSNPAHGEVNSIQHYVIKFVSDLRIYIQISENKGDNFFLRKTFFYL